MFQITKIARPVSIFKRTLFTKTTINPKSIQLNQPNAAHDSLILLTTPPQLNNVVNALVDENSIANKLKQKLVVCVDSIANSRNGYSELWLNSPFSITKHETIEERNERIKKKIDPLSVDPIKFDKAWKDTKDETMFEVNFTNLKMKTKIRLANTLFENGENSTCFFVGNEKFDWYNLANITIDVNLDNISNIKNIEYCNRLTEIPLVENETDLYTITDFEGNLIKSINNQSASGYLIDNSLVMDSKKDLYFKLYEDENHDLTRPWGHEYYKLIVGGLGWGEKQAFLAVDPIVGTTGYKDVKLYFYDKGTKQYSITSPQHSANNKLIFECSELEDGYEEYSKPDDKTCTSEYEGVFAMGCENGFELDGIWHRSNGEFVDVEINS